MTRRLSSIATTLLTLALISGLVVSLALPAAGSESRGVVEEFLTPTPQPSPSIYVPVYPDERSGSGTQDPPALVQPPVLRSKEPPSLEGRLAGIDISHWQGPIQWQQVAADGVSFVIAKASEAGTFRDGRYLSNRLGAKAAGLRFTAYEYARPTRRPRDAIRDANHFLRVARLTPDDLVPVLDLEETGGLTKDQLRRWVDSWCDQVYAKLGVRPMIYVSSSFWSGPMRDADAHAELGHPLWVAHWHVTAPRVPASMWADQDWTMWQWTSDGRVEGIDGRVDMNVFNGTDLTPLTIAAARAEAAASPKAGVSVRSQPIEKPDRFPVFAGLELLEELLF